MDSLSLIQSQAKLPHQGGKEHHQNILLIIYDKPVKLGMFGFFSTPSGRRSFLVLVSPASPTSASIGNINAPLKLRAYNLQSTRVGVVLHRILSMAQPHGMGFVEGNSSHAETIRPLKSLAFTREMGVS